MNAFQSVTSRHQWLPGALHVALEGMQSSEYAKRTYELLAAESVAPMRKVEKQQPKRSRITKKAHKLFNAEQVKRNAKARRELENRRDLVAA